ncbi:hypothetical protein POM88_028176 [Heracleum sosnowskyi]|uniref:PDZ domain-containing protein n=1 Tax=Heracleum sosnowskyi TaxID=360622 RepID=A0AAD8IBF6_9APIA|nr:hypothetical protein POM88_028176 [Heracleum sosnowskyi]
MGKTKSREKNKAKLVAAAESYNKLKSDYENLLKENASLKDESKAKAKAAATQSCYSSSVPTYDAQRCYSSGVPTYDPQCCYSSRPSIMVYQTTGYKPELCPRFPQQRETLSLDAGFAQTPVLQELLYYRDHIVYPVDIHYEMENLGLDPSTTGLNNKDLGIVSSKIAPSVVAVSSFLRSKRKINCSGLIIHWSSSEKEATILTSAKLLYHPKDSKVEFHLIVRMADGTLLLAKEEHVDYYYNILTLKVKPIVEPEVVDLRSRQVDVVDGMKVISLGRSFFTSTLYDSSGKLYDYPPYFGCCELLTSDCGIPEIGEGGPLVTDTGYVVGINFFGQYQRAHPLPTPTILSCLEMWKSFSTILRPWFGIRVLDVKQFCNLVSTPEKKVDASDRDLYVFVEEVYEGSVAHKHSIKSRDIVATLNGTQIETAKQYSQLLSEASRAATACDSGHHLMAVINPFDRPTDDIIIEADYISVDDKRFSTCWPFDVDGWFKRGAWQATPSERWLILIQSIPDVTLNSGNAKSIPVLGPGRGGFSLSSTRRAVLEAIGLGYRMFATATFYQTKEALGEAIS